MREFVAGNVAVPELGGANAELRNCDWTIAGSIVLVFLTAGRTVLAALSELRCNPAEAWDCVANAA